jgi:hypothetical protein
VVEPGGKPRLDLPPPPAPLPQAGGESTTLHFNLTHTGDLALLAVARREVGIDVEQHRLVRNAVAIARRMWPPTWAAELEALGEPARSTRFLELWTRFEAQQKACGHGMFGQRSGDFAGRQGEDLPSAARGRWAGGEGKTAGQGAAIHTLSFHPDPDHLAALAWPHPEPPREVLFVTTDPAP